jgi:hypothetical protein
MTRTITVTIETPEGDVEHDLPTRWEICSCCRGEGTSSAYLGAITQSDREPGGSWDDPEDFAEYMRGGYDRTCDACAGAGKVKVVDEDRCAPDLLAAWHEQRKLDAELDAIERAERRMGA